MENLRDIVLIVAGIVWSIVDLAILVIVLAVFFFTKRYLDVADRFLLQRVGGFLEAVVAQAEGIRQRSAGLPGLPPQHGVAIMPAGRGSFRPRLPSFLRRRPWWQRLIQR